MRRIRLFVLSFTILALPFAACNTGAQTVAKVSVTCNPNALTAGSTISCNASGTDTTGKAMTLPAGTSWSLSDTTVASVTAAGLVTGKAAGSDTITATNSGVSGSTTITVESPAASSTSTACTDCWLSVGVGVNLEPKSFSDYSNAGTILQTTHLGNATPQFLLGVSYSLPWRDFAWRWLGCSSVYSEGQPKPAPNAPDSAQEDYCYPWKAFVNVKFATGGSQTFSGFTMGLAHSVMSKLDIMVGASFSPFNEVTSGFRSIAIQTVEAQQAAKNPYYTQFSLAAMEHNWRDAFDGFPTTLVSSNGAQGAPIYAGSPLSVNYHLGGFIGINVPLSFTKLLGIPNPTP